MQKGGLVALWLGAALFLVPVLFGALPGFYNLVLGAEPLAERIELLWVGMVYLGYFGAFFALVAALPYGIVLYAWSRVSRRTPVLEKDAAHVAAFTAILALPTAIFASLEAARFAGSVRWDEALGALPLAFLIPWCALLIPRLVIGPLKPGAFLERLPKAAA